jgi:coenzyme F420-reducing hydrogenase beta subunit
MKKINIVTYYKEPNYGAFLQCFALQNYLINEGYDTRVLTYNTFGATLKKIIYKVIKRKKALRGNYLQYNNSVFEQVKRCQNRFNVTTSSLSDVTVVGSDEVWSIRNFCAPHNACFFNKSRKTKKIISYAACSGTSKIKDFNFFKSKLRGIKSFDAVSVRDDSTETLIKKLGIKNYSRVLDPTFLLDFEPYLPNRTIKEDYLLVYSYGLSDDQINEIKEIAEKKKLKVVLTGTYGDWADYNPAPNPFGWIELIKNASYVITSTFHGTAFSIELKKQFAVYSYGSAKINSLLRELGLLKRRISEWNSITDILAKDIDYNRYEIIIQKRVEESKKYLRDAIEGLVITGDKISNNKAFFVKHIQQDVVNSSRSGGAFTAISDYFLSNGGVIYGAAFTDDFRVAHKRAENITDRNLLRGSKYVQSDISECFEQLEADLKNHRPVLFTGTPCQVHAVKKLAETLKLDEYLYTLDFVCHGVPSPEIWEENLKLHNNLKAVSFRNKARFGWRSHVESYWEGEREIDSDFYTHLYYRDLISRPACHDCPYAKFERVSDITIADAWGVENLAPELDKNDGVSLIILNTIKGTNCFELFKEALRYKEVDVSQIDQPVMLGGGHGAVEANKKRKLFWNDYYTHGYAYVQLKYGSPSRMEKMKKIIKRFLGR